MKLGFLLLLLVNLLLFGWQQGVFGRFAESGREPERVARQVEPERIRVLTDKEMQALRARVSQAPGAIDLAIAQSCVEFGDFAAAELGRAEKALATLATAGKPTARIVEAPGWTMVYVAPFKTRAEVDRRAEELRKLGIKDMVVMGENGPLKFGISLGSFREAEAAAAHLAALERLGVKGARVSDKPSTISATRFQLRDLDAGTARQLAVLRSEFPAQSVRPCSGPA